MSEFVRRSRKSGANTHNFEVEKLEKPANGQSLEFLEREVEDARPEELPQALPRLPWQLERLVCAASLETPLRIEVRGIFDVNRYILAWGCSYLTKDQDEALRRLWYVYSIWQPSTKGP